MSELPDYAGDIPDAAPATTLIVGNQPENLGIYSKVLKPHFRVRAARSGHQALRAAGTDPKPEVTVLDVSNHRSRRVSKDSLTQRREAWLNPLDRLNKLTL